MNVSQLVEHLTQIGATVTPEGNELFVSFPEDRRHEVEGLEPEIRKLKPELLQELGNQRGDPTLAVSKEVLQALVDRFGGPPEKFRIIPAPVQCPILPLGVRLVRYSPKLPPVDVFVCLVVTDVASFITRNLEELDARLNHPVQIRAGGSVFEILAKLAEVGVELSLEVSAKLPERST